MAVASNQTPPKRGHLIIDGTSYDANSEGFMDQFINFSKQNIPEDQQFAIKDVIDQLNQGKDVTVDSLGHKVGNFDVSELTSSQQRRMKRRQTGLGQALGSLFNTEVHRAKSGLNAIRNFKYIAPQKKEEKQAVFPKTTINFTNRVIDYNDENGKKVFSNRPSNLGIVNDIRNLINYFKLGDNNDSQYEIKGINVNNARALFNQDNTIYDQLLERIQQGTTTEQDKDILSDLLISIGESPITPEQQAERATIAQENQRKALNRSVGLPENFSSNIQLVNENGRLKIANWNELFGNYNKVHFNEASPYWGTKFQDYVGMNGYLYSPQDVINNVDNVGAEFAAYKRGWTNLDPEALAQSGVYYYNNSGVKWTPFNPKTNYVEGVWDVLKNLEGRLKDNQHYLLTNVSNAYNLPEGGSLYAYLDPNSPRSYLGQPKVNYIYYNPTASLASGNYKGYNNTQAIPYKTRASLDVGSPISIPISNWESNLIPNTQLAKYTSFIDPQRNIEYNVYRGKDGAFYIQQPKGNISKVENLSLLRRILNKEIAPDRENLSILVGNQRNKSFEQRVNDLNSQNVSSFQFGGVFKQIQTGGTSDPTKTELDYIPNLSRAEIKPLDITDDSVKWSTADKWALGALGGDMLSLGVSLVGGGNPVAAGIGAGSTIAQFVSDVKRDKLDWGDAGRALGSLGLDAITLLPGVGVFGKSLKIAKGLRRFNKVLQSAFVAGGLTEAASALSKINTEGNLKDTLKNLNVEDIRAIALGIQSIVGGKRLLLDKKLATSKRPIINQNGTPASSVTLNSKTNKDLSIKLTESETTRLKDLPKSERKEALNDLIKNKFKAAYSSSTHKNKEMDAWFDKDGNIKSDKTEQLLSDFGLGKTTIASKLKFWNSDNIPKVPKTRIETKRVLNNPVAYQDGEWFSNIGRYFKNRAINRYAFTHPDLVYGNIPSANVERHGVYDSWGRLIGRRTTDLGILKNAGFTQKNLDQIMKKGYIPSVIKNNNDYTYYLKTPQEKNINFTHLSELNNYIKSHKKGGILKFQNGGENDTNTKKWKLPKISSDSLYSLADLITSRVYNRKVHDEIEKGIRSGYNATLSAPQEIYDSFNTYGVPIAYENKAVREENYKPVTSDAVLANALEQQGQSQANQTRLEGRLKTSELFSDYLNRNNDLKRRYAQVRADVANQNRQIIANVNMQLAQNKASKLANDFTSFNNWLMEKRAKNALNEEKRNAINSTLLQGKLEHELSGQMRDLMKPYRDQFDTWYKDDANKDIRDNYSFESWLSEYKPEEYNSIQNQLYNLKVKSLIPYYNSLFKRPQFNAETYTNVLSQRKGGKVSSYNRYHRPAHEEIWIQQNKAANEAVKSLNNNIVRLFIKATSHENKKI